MKKKVMTTAEALEELEQRGLRPPANLTFAITGVCNLVCEHCWVGAGTPSAAAHVPERTARRVIQEFAALGGKSIRFTGGEPLSHPDWLGFMQCARRSGFRGVSLQTNAILFDDEQVAALRDLDFPGLSIQISLDGATAESYDLVRGAGAFAGALAGIRRLVRGGLARRISLFFTEMRHNLEEIPAVLELAADLEIGSVATGTLVRCGRADESALIAPPDSGQYLRLLERYDADPRFRELYEKLGSVAAIEWHKGAGPRSECCTFVENPYLTAEGRLYPCVLCHASDFAVAGVFEKSLACDFAEGAPLWSSLLRISCSRADTIRECRECPERVACAGGCMGRAWGSCGDLLAADDRCGQRRAVSGKKRAGTGPSSR